jgi:hypothetical protein
MKTLLTLCSSGLLALNVHAQPVLSAATNSPTPGTGYTINYGPYVSPGGVGANQTWNLSGSATDSSLAVQYVAPATTPNAAQFPTATVAEMSALVTQYYRVAADGIHFAGSDDGTSLIVHAPQGKFLAFPCTFGTSWSSPQNATFDYEGMPVTRTGNFSGHADGHGTLVMPGATIPNVLRVHWTNTIEDAMDFFTISYIYDSYAYFVAGQAHPIAEIVTASIDVGSGPQVNQFSRWSGDITTSIQALRKEQISVFPNPASEEVNINLPDGFSTPLHITVVDMAGRTVLNKMLPGTNTHNARLDVRSLFPGMYQLTVTTSNGQRSTVPLIIR